MKISRDQVAIYVLTAVLATFAIVNTLMLRNEADANRDRELVLREVRDGQVQTERFAAYMRCLIVPDEALYAEIGEAAYVELCEKQLFPSSPGSSPTPPSTIEEVTTTTVAGE